MNKDGRRKRREEGRERDRSNGENEGKMKGQEWTTERTNMKFCLECLKLFSSGFYHKDSRLRPHGGVFGLFVIAAVSLEADEDSQPKLSEHLSNSAATFTNHVRLETMELH